MANYNHEILVNYLRDVYSMELLVRKIEDDIHSTREDIQCEQALVEKVESTPIPAEGNISPPKLFEQIPCFCLTIPAGVCYYIFAD